MSDAPTAVLPQRRSAPYDCNLRVVASAAPLVLLLLVGNVAAQGTALKPPSPAFPPSATTPAPKPATTGTALTAPTATPNSQSKAAPGVIQSAPSKASPVTLTRFTTVKVDGKTLDLRTLSDATVLKGKSGRTITVERIKQLQARMDRGSVAPMMTAQKGQSLKSLATAPAGTLIALPGGRVASSQDLTKIQGIMAKLSVKRVIRPAPMSLKNVQPTAVVGQGLTLAEAMKRPANDVIQVGTRQYTAEQLRQMDALLKASPREPRGLLDRAGSVGGRTGRTTGAANLPGSSGVPAGQMPAKTIRKGDGK